MTLRATPTPNATSAPVAVSGYGALAAWNEALDELTVTWSAASVARAGAAASASPVDNLGGRAQES